MELYGYSQRQKKVGNSLPTEMDFETTNPETSSGHGSE